MAFSQIFIVGFSGSGKTVVGRRVAELLGWEFIDSDEQIVQMVGKSIEDIFDTEGESAFRGYEKETILKLTTQDRIVVATGGGVFLDDESRAKMINSGFCVCLEAQTETIFARLSEDNRLALLNDPQNKAEKLIRPLLVSSEGDVSFNKIETTKNNRQWAYAKAHWILSTDQLNLEQTVQEVVRAWHRLGHKVHSKEDPYLAATVVTSDRSYPIFVGWEILEEELGARLKSTGFTGRAYILCDQNVLHPYGRSAQRSLHKANIEAHLFVFPSGEQSKSLDTVRRIYDWMGDRKVERRDVVIGVGGGVAGDLAGFVAATYLRGIDVVHVPTTLTAMVDSSIGGKTAVDLPLAKNLIGAFHPPRFVLADVSALSTLPDRELTQGWAEALKHGLALDEGLLGIYEDNTEKLLSLDPEVTTKVVFLNVAVKARVVTEDERETSGLRTLLNYGHTVGHAIESAAGYGQYLHGEAVAIGMVAAGNLGFAVGKTSKEVLERQNSLISKFKLPTVFEGASVDNILQAISLDKKSVAGEVSWVMLDGPGRSLIFRGIEESMIRKVLVQIKI